MKAGRLFKECQWCKYFLLIMLLILPVLLNQGCIFAVEPLAGLVQPELPEKITFSEGRNSYSFPLQDFGLEITYNWDGEVFSGYILDCIDEEKLLQGIEALAMFIDLPAREASFKFDGQEQLTILPEYEGRKVDQEALYRILINKSSFQEVYPLQVQVTKPSITAEELQNNTPTTLWAKYATVLADIPDRTENVRIASSLLDGLILAPGQIFSFNDQVGPREIERGFREAKIIVGGKFEPGLGGGVCQVSSTLYNVVLLAGLEITERHNHSVRIAYVPLGRDATVAFGSKDFKFTNNTGSYIMIRTKLVGLKLEMFIFGKNGSPYEQVQLTSRVLKTVPTYDKTYESVSLEPGVKKLVEKGQNGYLSETYRQLKMGAEVVTQLLSKDYYLPQPNIYAEGGKESLD